MRSLIFYQGLLFIALLFSCDKLEDAEKCVTEYSDYTSKSFEYSSIDDELCSNKKLAEEYISYLDTEVRGSCVEDRLESSGESLEDIIEKAQSKLDECTN